jgi:hypothetical protein
MVPVFYLMTLEVEFLHDAWMNLNKIPIESWRGKASVYNR